jgi:hypothetical protein
MQSDSTIGPSDDSAGQPTAQSTPGQPLSIQATESLARADLASFLNVAEDQIQLVGSASRTWPDKGLGCAARKGVFEPQQTPGYEITLVHSGVTYRYHTDQQGRLIRCSDPGKPIGPISR